MIALWQNIQSNGIAIRGIVTRLDTAQPISAATITATAPGRIIRAQTRADGTFDLLLQPGSYDVSGAALGYRPFKSGIGSQRLIVREDSDISPIQLRLMPAGKIRGMISSSGGPAGLTVTALLGGYRWGRRTLSPVATAETDRQGVYHFPDLEPGAYYIRVERRVGAQGNERTYFPGKLMVVDSRAVTVAPAEEIILESFDALSAPVYTIGGRITTLTGNAPLAEVTTYLIPNYSQAFEEPPLPAQNAAEPRIRATGGFRINDVMPGSYNLFAIAGDTSGASCLVGAVSITVRDNITDIEVPLEVCPKVEFHAGLVGYPLPDFTGTTTLSLEPNITLPMPFQTLVASQSPLAVTVGVSPRNPPPAPTSPRRELFNPSLGSAMYANVPIGLYSLMSPALRNSFVRDVLQGNRSLLQDGIRVPQDVSTPVEIVFSMAGEYVTGVVQANGQPVPSTPVVLIPDPPFRKTFVWYKVESTDPEGRFNIKNIAPWTYKLFAWKGLEKTPFETSPYLNAEFIRAFETAGVTVDLRSGPQEGINVTLIEESLPPR